MTIWYQITFLLPCFGVFATPKKQNQCYCILMMKFISRCLMSTAVLLLLAPSASADGLSQTLSTIKPSVVGVGTQLPTRSPAIVFFATGFVVGDGLSVITNAHVVPEVLDLAQRETLGIVTGNGSDLQFRPATLAGIDHVHDLAHLRLSGPALPALRLGALQQVQEGANMAFTGFPFGMSLGMQPVTHRATVSAITPIVLPALRAQQLKPAALRQQRQSPFLIFQLDGTAYPGNSGSPLFDPDSGLVVGVINMTALKQMKENAMSAPSGISYAIPAQFVSQLLQVDRNEK